VEFDLGALAKAQRYKILSSCVTPRPIAWVTSRSANGILNAAPYSFFNVLGDDPPIIVLGILAHAEGRMKDSAANILATREFVVNLVSAGQAQAMNATSIDAPPDVDELALAGLETEPGVQVSVPRIRGAPASLECTLHQAITTGAHQVAVIAKVVHAYVADRFVQDRDRLYIDTPAMRLLGRVHGVGWYSLQTDLLQMSRPHWKDQQAAATTAPTDPESTNCLT
jgi:flavin reductase (DIM6/NTAB) family NADH-FMN oxidoreductase RutF